MKSFFKKSAFFKNKSPITYKDPSKKEIREGSTTESDCCKHPEISAVKFQDCCGDEKPNQGR
jgi:hypothetical protein